ncbi:MAG: protoheme IX farnesyltransferase [Phyllobacteriaceae bacterium]|nr:protoheme IX farnesyltransferase [Phyllobacteriaceae bacterium]
MSLAETAIAEAEVRFSEATPADFWALLKPRVMSLVVFTAFVGMMLAPGAIDPVLGAVAILAIAIGGGASGALNQWYDADIDALMKRTRNRPIPAGRVTRGEALVFGLVLSLLSVMTLALFANLMAGGLLAFTIFFYVVVYTMALKRSTPHNIVIGGAAGAFPSMIGWAAVTGAVTIESFALFLIVFLWTPPHFWALALFKSGDYGRAGIPMMPNVAGEAATKRQIFAYAVVQPPVASPLAILGFASPAFGVAAALLGAGFIWKAVAVWRMPESDRDMKPAKALFGFSLAYLAMIFAGLLADSTLPRLFALVAP